LTLKSSNKVHLQKLLWAGKKLDEATKALIMVHGRGGSAEDILSLSNHLQVDGYALIAPQATGNSWYPASFLAPPIVNEPWLTSALQVLDETVNNLVTAGISKEQIYFLGFSQGACLSLEYVARNATKYGGVAAFTGGLIGDKISVQNYQGNFENTPIFIGTSNPDPHVPIARVHATANILRDMNAAITEKVYEHMGHTINQDEIEQANSIVFSDANV
jgi:phospholipase/carboxylesterase